MRTLSMDDEMEQRMRELARDMADAGMRRDQFEAARGEFEREFEMRREFNERQDDAR